MTCKTDGLWDTTAAAAAPSAAERRDFRNGCSKIKTGGGRQKDGALDKSIVHLPHSTAGVHSIVETNREA